MEAKTPTHWSEIRAIEDALENQDATGLIAFIQFLSKRKLLTRFMLTALCNANFQQEHYWNLLHEFAGQFARSQRPVHEPHPINSVQKRINDILLDDSCTSLHQAHRIYNIIDADLLKAKECCQ